jgi:hypothetical protein
MKTLSENLRTTFFAVNALIVLFASQAARAELKPKERNILANEAKAIDLAKVMITDNSWNKLPGYKSQAFWE